MVAYLREFYAVSPTRACKTLMFAKSMYYYRSVKDDSEVIDKLLELSEAKPREGQDKYYRRLRPGVSVGQKTGKKGLFNAWA